jgi:hypothetical protein
MADRLTATASSAESNSASWGDLDATFSDAQPWFAARAGAALAGTALMATRRLLLRLTSAGAWKAGSGLYARPEREGVESSCEVSTPLKLMSLSTAAMDLSDARNSPKDSVPSAYCCKSKHIHGRNRKY